MLEERRRRIVRRSDTKDLSIAEIQVSERSLANAHRVREYGLEDRLQLAGRAGDSSQHLRCCCLLLQRLGEFARARRHLVVQSFALETGPDAGAQQRRIEWFGQVVLGP